MFAKKNKSNLKVHLRRNFKDYKFNTIHLCHCMVNQSSSVNHILAAADRMCHALCLIFCTALHNKVVYGTVKNNKNINTVLRQ